MIRNIGMLSLLLLISTTMSWAQPSDATILAKLKSNSKTISAKLSPKGGTSKKEVENGTIVYNYYRGYTVKQTTDYKGIYIIIDGEYKYQKVGGSYVFKKSFVVQNEYEGIPNPSESEIVALVKTDLQKLLGYYYSKAVGPVSIALADEPRWFWHKPSSVSMHLKLVYNEKTNSTELSKVQEIYKVRLYREGIKGKFTKFISSKQKKETKVLSKKTYSASELSKIPTMAEANYAKETQGKLDKLPKIDIPKFKTAGEVANFLHPLLLDGNEGKLEYFLRKTLSSSYFEEGSTLILSSSGEQKIKEMKQRIAKYKDQYCDKLRIKKQSDKSIEWYSKSTSVKTTVSLKEENGQMKVSYFGLGASSSQSTISSMAGFDCSTVKSTTTSSSSSVSKTAVTKSAVIARGSGKTLSKGANVLVKYKDYWYPAVLKSVSGKTFYTTGLDGRSFTGSASTVIARDIRVGDTAYAKANSGKMIPVKITKISGETFYVQTSSGAKGSYYLKTLSFK